MSQSMQPAIQHLFQASSLAAVSREQLETFVEDYPCFGFGHYLLSRKLRAENPDEFLTTAQKTSLYFSNPFWMQWMLENAPEPAPAAIHQHREPAIHDKELRIHDEEPPFVLDEPGTDHWPEMESPAPPADTNDLHPDTEGPSIAPELHPEEPSIAAEFHPNTEGPSTAAELLLESIETARSLRESIQKINEDFHSHNGAPESTPGQAQPPIDELVPSSMTEPAPPPPIRDEEPPFVLDEPEHPAPIPEPAWSEPAPSITETQVVTETPATTETPIAQSPIIAETPVTPPITETTPLFEPLHTIDYFASQGIRLTLDENPIDPLGRQLKSFTDWLRTMRRLPQKDREIVPDRVAEQNVQNFAAHSVEGKEPITETMAEVLAKQGMPERARLVYEKLSLLNPDKRAYFAAKIEQLNSH